MINCRNCGKRIPKSQSYEGCCDGTGCVEIMADKEEEILDDPF